MMPSPPLQPSAGRPRFPSRFVNVEAARRAFGARADTLGDFLWKTDPLAEAVVEAFSELPPGKGMRMLDVALDRGVGAVPSAPRALVELFESLADVPFWVDREQLDLGGATYRRCGFFALAVLSAGSLPMSYRASGGNKPLTFSRRLVEMAPRRLLDTMRFQLETCLPGGLEPGADGFKISIRVRLVHAQMRRILLASGRWNADAWGAPLNQADTAATNVFFSAYPLGWLRRLGFHFTPEESDAVIQLWRYSGHLLGIDPTLLSATEAEGLRLGALTELTQSPPDEDSRALTRGLMGAIQVIFKERYKDRFDGRLTNSDWVGDVWAGLAHFCLGEERASALGIPRTSYRLALAPLAAAVAQAEAIRRRHPQGTARALQMGTDLERYFVATPVPSQGNTMDAVLGAARRR